MRSLIVGCGYLGQRVAEMLHLDCHEVCAMTRSPERAAAWSARGWRALVADVMHPQSLADCPNADLAVYAVAHDRRSSVSKRDLALDGLGHVLQALTGRCRCLVYISSLSVYGQSDGGWVDETSPSEPVTESGRTVLEAERRLRQWSSEGGCDTHVIILRLAGLYGPGRLLARADSLRERRPLSGHSQGWLNLIHVDDAARLTIRCARQGRTGGIYLGVDDEPVRRADFYGWLADATASPPPVFDEQDDPAGRGSSIGLNKRCDNSRIRAELNFRCVFPTFREGLAHALNATAAVS